MRARFPLCNRVFLLGRCEPDVEVVDRWAEIGVRDWIQYGPRSGTDRFLTSRVGWEVGRNRGVEKVFHVSEVPTVTAGLIGFVFDIRNKKK